MKLLYCLKCNDAFVLLVKEARACRCGKSAGKYVDNLNAWYAGKYAIPFAIDNYSFAARIKRLQKKKSRNPLLMQKEFYDKIHGTNRVQCWIMQLGNPNYHTIKRVSLKKIYAVDTSTSK